MLPSGIVSNNTPGHPGRRDCLGSAWLNEARTYMLSGSAMATKRLIGKLYRAGEQAADNSEQGLCHPDAKVTFVPMPNPLMLTPKSPGIHMNEGAWWYLRTRWGSGGGQLGRAPSTRTKKLMMLRCHPHVESQLKWRKARENRPPSALELWHTHRELLTSPQRRHGLVACIPAWYLL